MASLNQIKHKCTNSVLPCVLLILLFSPSAFSVGYLVKELPGFNGGTLPFTLETGYTSVGNVEFFYYFVYSDGNPAVDPLLVYMNGGPGCTALNGFFYQIGPLKFNLTGYAGGIPGLVYEPNTWTKRANILFLDQPVGVGFSYATTEEAYTSSDTLNTIQVHQFIRNWLTEHPDFQLNPLFIGSDSYAGVITPMLAQAILDGNKAGLTPWINLKGYEMGCPHTDTEVEANMRIPFCHRLALISDALYEGARTSCAGNYVTSPNAECTEYIAEIDECINLINHQGVLDPYCSLLSPESNKAFQSLSNSFEENHRRALQEFTKKHHQHSMLRPGDYWCKNFEYLLMDYWLNYPSVREALHVRPGLGRVWRCNMFNISYTMNVDSVISYHKNLTSQQMQVLIFSGDHDMVIPHNGIEAWIKSLGLSIDFDWRPWFVDGQVSGYTRKYTTDGYRLTYATVKGSGHSPQEYKRKDCYQMFSRWIHYYPL